MTARIGADVNAASLRLVERATIREFVQKHSECFSHGTILDFGAGEQPYRDIVEQAGGSYEAFDRLCFLGSITERDEGGRDWPRRDFHAILCTQVLTLVDPYYYASLFQQWRDALRLHKGHLILTYGTCWPEIEAGDYARLTRWGVQALADRAGFETVEHVRRAEIVLNDVVLPLGGGLCARAV